VNRPETDPATTTESVCPVCLRTIPAERRIVGDTVELVKTCPDHGGFTTPVWRGVESWRAWGGRRGVRVSPTVTARPVEQGCPHDCGLCPDHAQQSCCVLIEVTSRCDLACPVCYAGAGRHGRDLDIAEIEARLDTLAALRTPVNVQLSGGEPTMRDDLPEIVRRVRARGHDFVQLNTNGIRLATDPDHLAALVDAGLDCVFLQFDGLDDAVHRRLRGAPLAQSKEAAIAACGRAGVGVVLVPTVVAGVNDRAIGAIVDFAVAHMPTVRAVHFQPMSQFGRCGGIAGDEARITLPEIVTALVEHSQGRLSFDDFRPGSAENPWCSFSGRFLVDRSGRLVARRPETSGCCSPPIERAEPKSSCCAPSAVPPVRVSACCGTAAAPEPVRVSSSCCGTPAVGASADVARARRYVAGQWSLPEEPGDGPLDGFEAVLEARARTLGLSAMAFQDAFTLDLDRLRSCHVHVVESGGRLIPFCAYNLTDTSGRALHRGAGG
jgi:uncharacterized radical SAM superfamily Fe-S cluster-containing enzyme